MNSNNFCHFCGKTFSSKYTLANHQDTAKKCLQLQEKNDGKFECKYCNKICSSKFNLESHIKNCKTKVNVEIQELKIQIQYLEQFKIYKELYEEEKQKVINLENKNNKLEADYKTLAAKAIENTGNKTTNNIVNNKNRIIQQLVPLTDDYMREQASFLSYKDVKNGIEGLAEFASKHTFKNRIGCSDVSRLNFVFKNEDGVIIKDPEGVEITKKFIEINRNELLRLLEEYFKYIKEQLDRDLDIIEYRHWSLRREEIIATRSAVEKGNIAENSESYTNFKKNFLSVLSELVAR